MTGIPISLAGSLAVVGALLLVVVILLVRASLRARVEWLTIPGFPSERVRLSYVAPPIESGSSSAAQVGRALECAIAALAPIWSEARIRAILPPLYIVIMPDETWTDLWSRRVGGIAFEDTGRVEIGPSLGVLAHELAHVAQWRLDQLQDPGHGTWGTRGIWLADSVYRRSIGVGAEGAEGSVRV